MTTLKELKQYCDEQSIKYPMLKEEIMDIYQLAVDEVEQGGSERHEIELALNDLEELIP